MAFPDPQDSIRHSFGIKNWLYDGEKWNLQPTGGNNVFISPDEPQSATEGDLWVDENTYYIYVYNDSMWIGLTGPTGGKVTYSAQPPTNAIIGDFWVERDTYLLYFYDGNDWLELTHEENDQKVQSLTARVSSLEDIGFIKLELNNK